MVRKLKFHEQKLLKKVDFISWEVDNNLHELKIMKKFNVQKREDYTRYVFTKYKYNFTLKTIFYVSKKELENLFSYPAYSNKL